MPVERQREYETIYIIRPDAGEEDFSTVGDRVEGIIETEGGHLLKHDDWGRRTMAYEIKDKTEGRKFEQGIYHYYRYMVPPGTVTEIERNLRLLDPVLKFLTVKLDDDLIPDERLASSAAEAEAAAKAKAEAEAAAAAAAAEEAEEAEEADVEDEEAEEEDADDSEE